MSIPFPSNVVLYSPNDRDQASVRNAASELRIPVHVASFGVENVEPSPDVLMVGGVHHIRHLLYTHGKNPDGVEFPTQLGSFYGRRILKMSWGEMQHLNGSYFVKKYPSKTGMVGPQIITLPFDHRTASPDIDVMGFAHMEHHDVFWVQEIVELTSEWRCFVCNGEILDVRPYRRDSWRRPPDPSVVEAAVGAWSSKPAGCAIDFGVTADGRTIVIEVNEGYALGSYGLLPRSYLSLLTVRWRELWS